MESGVGIHELRGANQADAVLTARNDSKACHWRRETVEGNREPNELPKLKRNFRFMEWLLYII